MGPRDAGQPNDRQQTLSTGCGYDAAGRMASMTYPSGRSIGYGYDGAGRLNAMTVEGQNLLTGIAWQPFGAARGWTQGNGRGVSRTYDRDGRLQSQTYESGNRSYGYDLKGRLTSIAEPWGSRTYGYDTADRLASETGWAGSYAYAWDGNGNRQSQTSPQGSTGYAYEAGSNKLQSASGVDARAFTHDTAGNMNAEGGYGYNYDARNLLALATSPTTSTSYGHDALGRRTFKSNTSTRYFAHDEQRKVIGEYDAASTLTETVWLGNTPVAVLRAGQTYWIDADQIDTPRAILNVLNQIVWRWKSEAFGNTQAEEDPSGLGAFEFNHRFPGQLFDSETALHHNDHREYRAHTGRYVQSDPIGLAGGINTYAYVGGNPNNLVDPLGLFSPAAHDRIFEFALRDRVSPAELVMLQQASRDFDARTQAAGDSHLHSMRNGDRQSAAAAIAARDRFIQDALGEARAMRLRGDRNGALRRFGEACHPIMDWSTPMHTDPNGNPREWNPLRPWGHSPNEFIGSERVRDLTPGMLDAQRNLLNRAYDSVFGPRPR